MPNIRGLEPFPRNYSDDIPRDEVPFLEDIRRASNAVRVLRRRGLPAQAAQFRAQKASEAYRQHLDRKQQDYMNPGLF